jgi:hypothetical protein
MNARAFAGLLFFAVLTLLGLAHRRLRDRARVEEADGLLREAFEALEHAPAHAADDAARKG